MAARLRRRRRPLGSPRGRAARSRPVRDARLPHRGGVVPRHPGRERAPRRPGIRRHAGHQRPARPRALRTDRARRRRRHPAARARGGTDRRGDRHRHRLRRPRRGALPGLRRALERRRSARERGRELRGRGAVPTRGAAHHLRLRPAPGLSPARRRHLLPDPLAAVHSGLRRAGRQRGDELVPPRRASARTAGASRRRRRRSACACSRAPGRRASLRRFTARVGRQPPAPPPTGSGPGTSPAAATSAAELERFLRGNVPLTLAQTYTHYLPCGDHAGQPRPTSALAPRAFTTRVSP